MRFSGGKTKAAAAVLGLGLIGSLFWAVVNNLPRKITICELQGNGQVSPFQDREVLIRGVVDQTSLEEGEFALLDDSCPVFGQGSRGVLVSLDGAAYPLQLGDEIEVQGLVREVEGETRLAASPQDLEILSLDNPFPEPADLIDCLQESSCCSLEDWEGQLLRVPKQDSSGTIEPGEQIVSIPELISGLSRWSISIEEGQVCLDLPRKAGSPGLEILRSEEQLEKLTGLVRQNRGGYFLQLVDESNQSLTYPRQQEEGSQPEWQAAGSVTMENTPTSYLTHTLTPSPTASWTPVPTVIPSPTYYPIPLLITEILPNPAGEEPGGEWIEVYNPGGKKLPLDGIKIGDEISPDGKEGLVRFPDGFMIAGGEVLVIANQARAFEAEYGFRPDFELSDSDSRVPDLLDYPDWGRSAVQLSNTADEVVLVSPWDQILDLVAYGPVVKTGASQLIAAPKEGHSLERYPPELDRNIPSDWRESSEPSPGSLNRTPPSQTPSPFPSNTPSLTLPPFLSPTESPKGTLTITASPVIHTVNPTGTSSLTPTLSSTPDSPPTMTPVWTKTALPAGTDTPLPTPGVSATGTLTQTASQTPAPSPTGENSLTYTVTGVWSDTPSPAIEISQTISPTIHDLTPSVASSVTPTLIPSAVPSLIPTVSASSTPSITITPSLLATETPLTTAWITDTPQVTEMGTLTPISTSTTLAPLQINEIHADPDPLKGDSNGDGEVDSDDDEFLELVNLSGDELILDGWEIYDSVRLRYTFPAGTVLKAGCGLLVFGGGSPTGEFGGSLVFTAGSLGLNNSGDQLVVKNLLGEQITSCSYGEEGGEDQSLTRSPDLTGELPLVLHSLVIEAHGALFSPGWRADGTAFGDCP
jgi:hypothetical protein